MAVKTRTTTGNRSTAIYDGKTSPQEPLVEHICEAPQIMPVGSGADVFGTGTQQPRLRFNFCSYFVPLVGDFSPICHLVAKSQDIHSDTSWPSWFHCTSHQQPLNRKKLCFLTDRFHLPPLSPPRSPGTCHKSGLRVIAQSSRSPGHYQQPSR